MPDLPSMQPTVDAIYKEYENRKSHPRAYIGGSSIGEECKRKLWYRFRLVRPAKFEGRILRLFETGHREEARIKDNLRAIGVEVHAEEFEIVFAGGHGKGHLDCVLVGLLESPQTPHVTDMKTMNKKNYDAWLKHGTEKQKPVYYAQLQIYGAEIDVTRWALVVQCKDDDRIHIERGPIKKRFATALKKKAQSIVDAEAPPERISENPSFYKCKFCDMVDYCHGVNVIPDVNCRTCVHGAAGKNGAWDCANGYPTARACDDHVFIPELLHWATPVDGDPTWVEYKTPDGSFVNCAATGMPTTETTAYSSKELRETSE